MEIWVGMGGSDAMIKLKRINVVYVYVADMERARAFYEGVLGLGPALLKNANWAEYALADGGSHFALHRSGPEAMGECAQARNTVKFSIIVDDLEAAHEEFKARGVTILRGPEKGYGFNILEFEDPEGNPLRLLQYTTMKPPLG